MSRKRLIKTIKRKLPMEATENLTNDPQENLIGFIKLLIELDRQNEIHAKVTKLL
jgi:hypothetical protein